jgi:pimeloyl-ACP methyl ester carboxylesterase
MSKVICERKRVAQVGDARVAYYDEGGGPAVLLPHGCPFASFVWRNVIPVLVPTHRCVAPDLLGLGETETPPSLMEERPERFATLIRDFLCATMTNETVRGERCLHE